MMFTYHSNHGLSKGQMVQVRPSRKPSLANPLRILTAKPKRRPTHVTVPASKATFIMLEARQISDHFGLVFWTLINSAYVELTLNWLCQTSNMSGIHERVFIITTDEESAAKVRSQWPLISVLSLRSNVFNSSLIWGERQYNDFLVLRASILRLFVDNDVRFVLFETDAVWLRNPYEYFVNRSRIADVVLPKKYQADTKGRDLTFDPVIVTPNGRTKRIFSELYRRMINPDLHTNGTLHDQDVIDDLCKSRYGEALCLTFPWDEVADGQWFKLGERKRQSLPTYIVNNNFYSGVENKITRQALNDYWFLTVDGQCSKDALKKLDEWNAKRNAILADVR